MGDALTLLTASCIYCDSPGSVYRDLAVPPAWTSCSFCTWDSLCPCSLRCERRLCDTTAGCKPWLHRYMYLTVLSLDGAGLRFFSQVVVVKLSEHQDTSAGRWWWRSLFRWISTPGPMNHNPNWWEQLSFASTARRQVNRDQTFSPRGPQARSASWPEVTEGHWHWAVVFLSGKGFCPLSGSY